MGAGIKMSVARKSGQNDREFAIAELSKEDNGTLLCRHCSARIQYVSEHTRHTATGEVHIPAYLKLWQEEEHETTCPHTVLGAIRVEVAHSQAIEDAPAILQPEKGEEGGEEGFVFRMNLLTEAQTQLEHAKKAVEADKGDDAENTATKRREYVRAKHTLTSYFRSARGIIRIRSLIDHVQDVKAFKQSLKIKHNGGLIAWDDFYFDQTRYGILHKRLCAKKINHPIAVQVVVKKPPAPTVNSNKYTCSVQCYSQLPADGATNQGTSAQDPIIYVPRLYFTDKKNTGGLAEGNTLLVVGDAWTYPTPQRDNNSDSGSTKPLYGNLNISIVHKAQWAEDAGTT